MIVIKVISVSFAVDIAIGRLPLATFFLLFFLITSIVDTTSKLTVVYCFHELTFYCVVSFAELLRWL